jgi:hypothetical protein
MPPASRGLPKVIAFAAWLKAEVAAYLQQRNAHAPTLLKTQLAHE